MRTARRASARVAPLARVACARGTGVLSTGGHPALLADLIWKRNAVRFVLFWKTAAYHDACPFMARGFFESIAEGCTYAEAFEAGRQCIIEQKVQADAYLLTRTNPHSLPPNMLQLFELIDPACATVVKPQECGQLDASTWEILLCRRNPRSPEELAAGS